MLIDTGIDTCTTCLLQTSCDDTNHSSSKFHVHKRSQSDASRCCITAYDSSNHIPLFRCYGATCFHIYSCRCWRCLGHICRLQPLHMALWIRFLNNLLIDDFLARKNLRTTANSYIDSSCSVIACAGYRIREQLKLCSMKRRLWTTTDTQGKT